MDTAGKTPKGEQTRERILDAALNLFKTQGYAETTMRQIADAAGVAVGNAYYYYASKDKLILAFYERNHADHLFVLGPTWSDESDDFQERLRLVLRTKVATAMPYRRLATKLFTSAADPESPLSPFSPESAPLRDAAIRLMAEVVDGSALRVGKDLRDDLPELLWLYEMGVILYWVHDSSDECEKTYALIDRTVPLVERLVGLAKLPVVRPMVREVVAMLGDLRPATAPAPARAAGGGTRRGRARPS